MLSLSFGNATLFQVPNAPVGVAVTEIGPMLPVGFFAMLTL
jgi:hypothetical protein